MDATKPNPATPIEALTTREDRKRIPMSVPTRRLEVPPIPGYHCHWFLESRVPRAIQGGYVLVEDTEVTLNQKGLGVDTTLNGNIDLGTRVRQIGGMGEDGKLESLVLMKIREEWWLEDRKAIDERNANVLAAIFRDEVILGAERDKQEDRGTRYVDRERTSVQKAVFNRPTRKR